MSYLQHPDPVSAETPPCVVDVVDDGLVKLVIADKGEKCNGVVEENELIKAGKVRYVYLDTSGDIVLRQKEKK